MTRSPLQRIRAEYGELFFGSHSGPKTSFANNAIITLYCIPLISGTIIMLGIMYGR